MAALKSTAGKGRRATVRKTTATTYQQLSQFRYALRKFLRFSEEAARAAGLMPQQHQALLAIRGSPAGGGLTVGQLAERLQIKHHSAVGLVDRLVSQGLLRRVPGSRDRRQVELYLTARSTRILSRLTRVHANELRQVGPVMVELLTQLHEPS